MTWMVFHGAARIFWVGGLLSILLSALLTFVTASNDGTYFLTFGGFALIALAFIVRKKTRNG